MIPGFTVCAATIHASTAETLSTERRFSVGGSRRYANCMFSKPKRKFQFSSLLPKAGSGSLPPPGPVSLSTRERIGKRIRATRGSVIART